MFWRAAIVSTYLATTAYGIKYICTDHQERFNASFHGLSRGVSQAQYEALLAEITDRQVVEHRYWRFMSVCSPICLAGFVTFMLFAYQFRHVDNYLSIRTLALGGCAGVEFYVFCRSRKGIEQSSKNLNAIEAEQMQLYSAYLNEQ